MGWWLTPECTDPLHCSAGQRRAVDRWQARAAARCKPVDSPGSRDTSGQVTDVSPVGVGLVVRDRYATGEAVAIELSLADGRPWPARVAYVIWSEPRLDGSYRLGCVWRERLNEAEMLSLAGERLRTLRYSAGAGRDS